jgi:hypothetical protein
MVDASPLRQQQPLHILPHRDRLPGLRQLRLRLGSNVKRAIGTRGFWSAIDEQQHITWKELKAVRLAVLSFLPLLRGRKVLMHEDNQAVVVVLSHLTSRSPAMMD